MPDDYTPPKIVSTGKGTRLKERLTTQQAAEKESRERRERLIDQHVQRSITKRALDIVFTVALIVLFVDTVATTFGMAGGLFASLRPVLMLFYLPVQVCWPGHPAEEPVWRFIGHYGLPSYQVVSLALYGVLYPVLLAAHRFVSSKRTYIPE
jgi:hypothetical protein